MTAKQLVLDIVGKLPDDISLDEIREKVGACTEANGAVAPNELTKRPTLSAVEFASLKVFGMWADRSDMTDSKEWVRQERATWQQRLSRPD